LNYTQLLAQAMLKMGEADRPGAEAEFQKALEEARRVDPRGPREAEVLSYLAHFHRQGGQEPEAQRFQEAAEAIFSRWQDKAGF
jgi:hypothetical protein